MLHHSIAATASLNDWIMSKNPFSCRTSSRHVLLSHINWPKEAHFETIVSNYKFFAQIIKFGFFVISSNILIFANTCVANTYFANCRILTGWAWSLLSDALFANCLTSFASFGKVVIGSLHKLPHSPPAPMKVGESKSGWPSSTTTSPIECSPTKNLKEDCRVFKSNGKATLVGLFSPYLHFSEPTALIPNKYISNFWQNIKIIHFKIWTKL